MNEWPGEQRDDQCWNQSENPGRQLYVYVCVCICTRICDFVYIHTVMYVHTHVYIVKHSAAHTYINIHVYR